MENIIKQSAIQENQTMAVSIMEATERFEFVGINNESNSITFFDNCWKQNYNISTYLTLEELIQWIINFYKKDYMFRGKQAARKQIKSALGID